MRRVWLAAACAAALWAAEPQEAMEHARRGYEMARRGDLAGAAAEIESAIRLAPGNPLYLSAMGGLVERQGKAEEALGWFERAVALDGANPALRFQLARRQWAAGRLEAAHANALKLAEAQPGDAEAAALLEGVALDLGAEWAKGRRYRAGMALAEDAARRFPKSAPVQQMLGLFAARNQRNLEAAAAYRRALELDPEAKDVSVGLGIAQSMAGQLAEAVATFEAGIAKWPGDALHRQALGVLLLRMAEADPSLEGKAVRTLEQALALDGSLAEAHYQLGNRALARGETRDALRHLLTALGAGDASSKLHFALSRAYRAAGDAKESARHAALFAERKRAEGKEEGKP